MELDETTMGIIGILAGILILSGWVPQIIRGYRTKKLNDVSSYLMILIFAGAVLWLIYGMALDDVYIMGVNLAAMVLTMIVLSMKLKYERTINQQVINMFIINCKNYNEISGVRINKLASIAEKISKKHKIKIALAPPHHQLASIKKSKLLVFAQHLDDAKIGSTTGYMIPEIVKKSKVNGTLINHSEHRISSKEITNLVKRLKKLKMKNCCLCKKMFERQKKYARLNPTYIAIEPPELIGTGRAISNERPELITKSLLAVKKARNSTKLLCGAGIVTTDDVKRAIELGSHGILVASGIVKSRNWNRDIEGFAKAIL